MKHASGPDWDDLTDKIHALVADPLLAHTYDPIWAAIEPTVERWVATPSFLGRVSDDEDLRREIVVRAWIKLRDRDHACLRAFVARSPATGAQLRSYLYRVVKNLGTDYLRSLPELARAPRGPDAPTARWHQFVEWTPSLEVGDGDASAPQLVHRLLAILDAPATGAAARNGERRWYRSAIELWSCGFDNREVAAALGMPDGATADRVINAAKELLRRRYRDAA